MGLLTKRISNFFRQKGEDIANSNVLKDDVRDGKFAIEDGKKKVQSHQASVAEFMGKNRGFKRKAEELKNEVKKWTRLATQAVENGKPDDVIGEALTQQENFEGQLKEIKKQITINDTQISKQRQIIATHKARIAKAENNHAMLSARSEGNKSRMAFAKKSAGFESDGDPLSALDDLQKSVDTDEDQIEAYEEMGGVGKPSLEEEITGGSDSAISDKVAALKAKMAAKTS